MVKCNKCWKRCDRPKMPKEDVKEKSSFLPWVSMFFIFVCCGVYNVPSLTKINPLKYFPPNANILSSKQPAVRVSGVDFVSENVRERLQDLSSQMDFTCNERSDDVVFAFQFGTSQRLREDHMFMLCSTKIAYANVDIVSFGSEMVLCTEEYGGVMKQVKRPGNIVVRGIHIDSWEVVEVELEQRDACVVQHAVDMLESKWSI